MTTTLTNQTLDQARDQNRLNGIDVPLMRRLQAEVKNNPDAGHTHWGATTRWINGAVSETEIDGFRIDGHFVERNFKFRTDEPRELAGSNLFPNPQEYLLSALNACMVVGYVALSTHFGIELESIEIECNGEIDLRGFLGLSKEVKPGYDEIHYHVRIKGNGTREQFEQIHEMVKATSPNYFNLSQPVRLTSELILD